MVICIFPWCLFLLFFCTNLFSVEWSWKLVLKLHVSTGFPDWFHGGLRFLRLSLSLKHKNIIKEERRTKVFSLFSREEGGVLFWWAALYEWISLKHRSVFYGSRSFESGTKWSVLAIHASALHFKWLSDKLCFREAWQLMHACQDRSQQTLDWEEFHFYKKATLDKLDVALLIIRGGDVRGRAATWCRQCLAIKSSYRGEKGWVNNHDQSHPSGNKPWVHNKWVHIKRRTLCLTHEGVARCFSGLIVSH